MNSDAPHHAAQIDFPLSLRSSSRPSGHSVPIERYVAHATEREHIDILQLAFETKHLRTLCESSADAIRELGQELARDLMERLADLDSAVTINDVLLGQ